MDLRLWLSNGGTMVFLRINPIISWVEMTCCMEPPQASTGTPSALGSRLLRGQVDSDPPKRIRLPPCNQSPLTRPWSTRLLTHRRAAIQLKLRKSGCGQVF